jgi:hypothetical protein
MPIKLSLRNDDDADPGIVTIKFKGKVRSVAVGEAPFAVAQWMEEIVRERNGGKLVGLVDEEMVIEVKNSYVPTLDLIDLPGIVAASIEGEPTNMMSQTRALVERYIREKNTLVIAVVSYSPQASSSCSVLRTSTNAH